MRELLGLSSAVHITSNQITAVPSYVKWLQKAFQSEHNEDEMSMHVHLSRTQNVKGVFPVNGLIKDMDGGPESAAYPPVWRCVAPHSGDGQTWWHIP